MKTLSNLAVASFLLAIFCSCGAQKGSGTRSLADQQTICIQTFNAYGPTYSWNLAGRSSAVGSLLMESPCEVVQFQEVWSAAHYQSVSNAIRLSLPNLSASRADNLQSPYLGQSGLAIFTSDFLISQSFEKFTINSDGVFDQVRGVLGVIKGFAWSKIMLRRDDASSIDMINLHLHPDSVPVRIAQVVQVLEKFESLLPLSAPVMVTGDFNFKPNSVEYELFKNVGAFTDSYVENHGGYTSLTCTYCDYNPQHWGGGSRVIDYIWIRSSKLQKIKSTSSLINLKQYGDVIPSDHFGLRANIELVTEAGSVVSNEVHYARAAQAGHSVVKAIEILEQADEETYADVIAKLRRYRTRLLAFDPSDPIVQQLIIP